MTEKLTYSRFFPPRNGQGLYYYLVERVRSFRRVIKYSWQRARRGWADCDAWNIDSWFCSVTPEIVRKLAEDKIGVPAAFIFDEKDDLDERWECFEKMLLQMANDLEALDRFWGVGWEEHDFKDVGKAEEAAERRRKAGLASFYEWFDCLWS